MSIEVWLTSLHKPHCMSNSKLLCQVSKALSKITAGGGDDDDVLGLCCWVIIKRRRRAGGGSSCGSTCVLGLQGRGRKGGVIWGAFGVRERLKDPEDETVRMEVRGDLL